MTRRPTTPGEILQQEYLVPLEMSQKDLADHIERWMNFDSRCNLFLDANEQKVKSKIQEAARSGESRLLDLLFEFQMGCLLSLHTNLVARYEYFGSGQAGANRFDAPIDRVVLSVTRDRRLIAFGLHQVVE